MSAQRIPLRTVSGVDIEVELLPPLPFRHSGSQIYACQIPEVPNDLGIGCALQTCPGCCAWAMAVACERPHQTITVWNAATNTKFDMTAVAAMRDCLSGEEHVADRIFFERALAERWMETSDGRFFARGEGS